VEGASVAAYAPFERGEYPVSIRTIQAADARRGRVFPCEVWSPVADGSRRCGPFPLIAFVHGSGGNRKSAAYLCSHLASHGYVVAAMDHSEIVAPELAAGPDESAQERTARIDSIIASRVPDVRFLLDFLRGGGAAARRDGVARLELDHERIGLVGHSFGGWTVLAVPEVDTRVGAIVALGPGGSSNPRPGILPLSLTFGWDRDVAVLYLAADDDVPIPLEAVRELYGRTPGTRRMFVLRRADHQHFLDDVEGEHEALRAMTLPGEAAWIPAAPRPMSQLCSGEEAHVLVRGLTLAHLDWTLRGSRAAEQFLEVRAEVEVGR
jgi:dienelactone hydrolase